MGLIHYLLILVAAFLVSAVLGYVGVALVVFTLWELTGVHDQDGAGAMAVGFFIAPMGALVTAILGTVFAARKLSKRASLTTLSKSEADRKVLVRFGLAILGFVIGWETANDVRYFLSGLTHEHVVFAIMFAATHFVIPPLFATAGFFFAKYLESNTNEHEVKTGDSD